MPLIVERFKQVRSAHFSSIGILGAFRLLGCTFLERISRVAGEGRRSACAEHIGSMRGCELLRRAHLIFGSKFELHLFGTRSSPLDALLPRRVCAAASSFGDGDFLLPLCVFHNLYLYSRVYFSNSCAAAAAARSLSLSLLSHLLFAPTRMRRPAPKFRH